MSAILTTHRHRDHWQALEEMVDDAGAAVYAGEEDADALPVAVDERLQHGDTIDVGDLTLEIIGLRGHTPGSVAVLYRDPEGVAAPVHRRLAVPRRRRQDLVAGGLHVAHRRRRAAHLRHPAGRDVVLPRPR